jgi:hypothetical protein
VWYKPGSAGLTFYIDGIKYYRPFDGVFDMELKASKRRKLDLSKWEHRKTVQLDPEIISLVMSILAS